MAACSSGQPSGFGGFLIHLASLPLGSSSGCRFTNAPLGSPRRSFSTSSSVEFIASDFWTKGLIVDSMRAFTEDGYSR